MKPEGYFKNGDDWHGYSILEDGKTFYIATDKQGNDYETEEMPTRYPLFSMVQFVGNWTAKQANQYLAETANENPANPG